MRSGEIGLNAYHVDSKGFERDYREKPVSTFSHPALGRRALRSSRSLDLASRRRQYAVRIILSRYPVLVLRRCSCNSGAAIQEPENHRLPAAAARSALSRLAVTLCAKRECRRPGRSSTVAGLESKRFRGAWQRRPGGESNARHASVLSAFDLGLVCSDSNRAGERPERSAGTETFSEAIAAAFTGMASAAGRG